LQTNPRSKYCSLGLDTGRFYNSFSLITTTQYQKTMCQTNNSLPVSMILLLSVLLAILFIPCTGFIVLSRISIRIDFGQGVNKIRATDTENLVDVIDKADCIINESTISSTSTSTTDSDTIVNGTPSRVRQNPLGKFADAASASVFFLLHVNDKLGIRDSSKNLRVLWSRSYLNQIHKIEDDIAYNLLPEKTRDVVKVLPSSGPLVDFQEFIVSRTEFIDSAVESFLLGVKDDNVACVPISKGDLPQVVLFGAGYDTRSLRYNRKAAFFEIDLPDVVEGKGRLQKNWKKQQNDDAIILPTRIGYDLNDAADSDKPALTHILASAGLRPDIPTLFVWEAVLFYVQPEAVMNIFDNVFRYGNYSTYCLVDSLKPIVTTSFLHKTRESFDKYGLDVIDHNSRWGGAVHFVLAGRKDSSLTKSLINERGQMPFSYLATSVKNGTERQTKNGSSFNNHWYAIAYPWQVGAEDVYATRLWGEPLVVYRDADSNLVCAKDSCPHRSSPMSMGKMNSERRLECM